MNKLKHIGVFSGLGGFEYAAKLMDWQTLAWVEIDAFCQQVLSFHYPNAKKHSDVKTTDFTVYRGQADVFTAGFPCQPSSTAGKRKGLDDDRWLWPETRRAYQECQPGFLILENDGGLLSILEPTSLSEVETKEIKLFSEDENYYNHTIYRLQQRAIGTIINQIKQDGYILPEYEDGTPIIFCIPACAVNAPHRRDRIWLFAQNANQNGWACNLGQKEPNTGQQRHFSTRDIEQLQADYAKMWAATNANSNGQQWSNRNNEQHTGKGWEHALCNLKPGFSNEPSPNSNIQQLQRGPQSNSTKFKKEQQLQAKPKRFVSNGPFANSYGKRLRFKINRYRKSRQLNQNCTQHDWANFPTQSPICSRNDGIYSRLHGITFSKWRQESIKGYGNAIVPQIVLRFYSLIQLLTQHATNNIYR